MANKPKSTSSINFFDDDRENPLRKYQSTLESLKLLSKYDVEPSVSRKPKADFSATTSDLNKKLDSVNARFTELQQEMQKVKDDAESNLKIETEKMGQKVEESKGRVIETLGLFVALFTFLSLQVQIMKDETSILNITGMLLLSGGMITFFVLLLDVIIRSKDGSGSSSGWRFSVLFALCILLIGGGITVLVMPR